MAQFWLPGPRICPKTSKDHHVVFLLIFTEKVRPGGRVDSFSKLPFAIDKDSSKPVCSERTARASAAEAGSTPGMVLEAWARGLKGVALFAELALPGKTRQNARILELVHASGHQL